jgi:hypothetical protein
VYFNPPANPNNPNLVGVGYIQYWLLNAASCDTAAGWNSYQFPNGGLVCWQNAPYGVGVPLTDVTNLTQLQLTGTASTSGDSVTVTVGSHAYSSQTSSDSVLNLAQSSWQAVEFNIFGTGCGYQAVFQGTPTIPPTIRVRTAVDNGTTNAPSYLAQSYTAETNNLHFGPAAPPPLEGTEPAVLFEEWNGDGFLYPSAAATSVAAAHPPPAINIFGNAVPTDPTGSGKR